MNQYLLAKHQRNCLDCSHVPINPLSPKIHTQILETDLYTFLLRMVERI